MSKSTIDQLKPYSDFKHLEGMILEFYAILHKQSLKNEEINKIAEQYKKYFNIQITLKGRLNE